MVAYLLMEIGMSVYIINSGGYVKIGVSDNPLARLRNLQTGNPNPLELLAVIPVGNELETALHKSLSSYRASGEWFKNEGDVSDLVSIMSRLFSPTDLFPMASAPQNTKPDKPDDTDFIATSEEIKKRADTFSSLVGRSIHFRENNEHIYLSIPGAIYDKSRSGPHTFYYPDGDDLITPKIGREVRQRTINDRLHDFILYALWNTHSGVSQKENGIVIIIKKAVQP